MDLLEESLTELGSTYVEYAKGYLCNCVLSPITHARGGDRNRSLAIWPEINRYQCYSCGQKGEIQELFHKLYELMPSDKTEKIAAKWDNSLWHVKNRLKQRNTKSKFYLDEEILENFLPISGKPLDYLLDRKLDPEVIAWYDIRMNPAQDQAVFPIRDSKGLLGAIGRHIEKKQHYKYFHESTLVLGGEDRLKHSRIIVVEGWIDVLKITKWAADYDCDVVCCWTSRLSDHHIKALASWDKYVFLMLDQDKAGHTGANDFQNKYPGLSTRLNWDFKNQKNEIADCGDMTENQFRRLFDV